MPTENDPAPLEARELSEEQVIENAAKIGKPSFERDFSKIVAGPILTPNTEDEDKDKDDPIDVMIESVRSQALALDNIYIAADAEFKAVYDRERAKYQIPSGSILDNKTREKIAEDAERLALASAKGAKAAYMQNRVGMEEVHNLTIDKDLSALESLYHAAPTAEAYLSFVVLTNPDLRRKYFEASNVVRSLGHATLMTYLAAAFAQNDFPLAAAVQDRLAEFPRSKVGPKHIATRLVGKRHEKIVTALAQVRQLKQSSVNTRSRLIDGKEVSSVAKITSGMKEQGLR